MVGTTCGSGGSVTKQSYPNERGKRKGGRRNAFLTLFATNTIVRPSVEFPSTAAFAYRYSVTAGGQVGLRHSPFKRGMREFESHPADQFFVRRSLTVEPGSHKPVGEGSIPSVATSF